MNIYYYYYSRLLLETNGGINEQYLQWVPYMPGTTTQDVPSLVYGTGRKAYRRVLWHALIKMVPRRNSTPLGRLEAHRSDRKF